MNKLWVGTNWKMHKTLEEGRLYCEELMKITEGLHEDMEVFIIPPYTSLWPIKNTVTGSRLRLGAQNMHWAKEGAFTGEISPVMLSEIGIDLIELGHSERRQYYNENDADINKKVHAALQAGIKPLICIGENMQQKQGGITAEVLAAQLKICLQGVKPEHVGELLIAYEPVWAIGESGVPAEADYVAEVHNYIRHVICELFGEAGREIPLLYGGSVNQENFLQYLESKEVNGLFIGRAAWNLTSFRKILQTIHSRMESIDNRVKSL